MSLVFFPIAVLLALAPAMAGPENEETSCSSDMVRVPGGTFEMGDWEDVQGDAYPLHAVRIDTFYLCRREVTIGEFRAFIDGTGYETSAEKRGTAIDFDGQKFAPTEGARWDRLFFEQSDEEPVTQVSWSDAVRYCNWLSAKEGLEPCYAIEGDSVVWNTGAAGYRLPTEAEWEYAATSGGKKYRYSWGNGAPEKCGRKPANLKDEDSRGFFGKSMEWKECWDGYADGYFFTAPAGTFAPSELGLHDMTGNVYEWCWDWYDETYYARSAVDNPRGPETGTQRACRGNGWNCPPDVTFNQHRGCGRPNDYWPNVGFRLARTRLD